MTRMNSFIVVLASLCLTIEFSDASMCRPLSKFRVDCNVCICKENGLEFSCTERYCGPIRYKDRFIEEQNEDGYTILKPKVRQDKYTFDEDIDSNEAPVLKRRTRVVEKFLRPYINDEIPPSKETFSDESENTIDDNSSNEDSPEMVDVDADLEEAHEANNENYDDVYNRHLMNILGLKK